MTDGDLTGPSLSAELDRISLNQALIDFEVANSRVLDLTRRLMESHAEVAALRAEIEAMRTDYDELRRTHEAMKSSQAFRTATRIWALRNAIGR